MKNRKKSAKIGGKITDGEILYGIHPIVEALKAKKRKLISIYTTKPLPTGWKKIQSHLPKHVPNIQYVSRDVLARMSGSKSHMGVVAWFTPYRFTKKIFSPKTHPFIVLVDSVHDIRNLGAILRSAKCTNVNGIVLCREKTATLNADAIKASAGLAEHMEIYVSSSPAQAIDEIIGSGYEIYSSVASGGQSILEIDWNPNVCLVIGNEEKGIGKNAKSKGNLITIPQSQPDISYNASVAAGIMMFYISYCVSRI